MNIYIRKDISTFKHLWEKSQAVVTDGAKMFMSILIVASLFICQILTIFLQK